MNTSRTLALAAIVLASGHHSAAAEDDARTWHGKLMPYAWVPASVSGDLTFGPDTVTMQANMADLLERIQFAGSMRGELWYGEFGLMVDVLYGRFGDERMTPVVNFELEIAETLSEAAFAYRLGQWPTSDAPNAIRITAELYGGVRVSRFSIALAASPRDRAETLVDPMFGVRVPVQLSRRWSFAARADIGGFGVDSDLVWNIVFGFERELSSLFGLELGYRIMNIGFSNHVGETDREVSLRTTTHGPGLAASVRF